jgi:hypothetical protein
LYIKAVQYKGGNVVPVWYYNTNFFTAAFKEVLKSTSGVDLGSEWLNYAMEFWFRQKPVINALGLIFKSYSKTSCL